MPELLTLKEQHPSDDLDHAVKFGEWIDTGDTIASCAVSVSSGIALGAGTKAPAVSGTDIVFWLSGGDSGREYLVQITAETTGGRRKTVDGSIVIFDPTAA